MNPISWAFQARLFVVFLSAALLAACGPNVLDFRNAEIVSGKIYKHGADSPFSGSVTNVPEGKILVGQMGFTALSRTLQSVLGLTHAMDRLLFSSSVCDVKVDDGVLDGEVLCTVAQSKMLRYQLKFKEGALHGPMTFYDLTKDNNVVATAGFKKGVLNGQEEIFSLKTQKLIHRIRWSEGRPIDEEEAFDENTGIKTASSTYRDGKLDGKMVQYAPDGKRVVYQAAVSEGLLHGVEERFDATTGKPRSYAEWTQGKRQGKVKEWDAAGNLKIDAVYDDDRDVTPRPVAESAR